jgi:aminoglycoside N3'-acetyltransferase
MKLHVRKHSMLTKENVNRKPPVITKETIAENLSAMGLSRGDVLYLRCGLSKIGIPRQKIADAFLGGIQEVLGSEGTLISPAFVPISFRWSKNIPVSNHSTRPATGPFSSLLLEMPGAVRSSHPTHSFVGIGKNAKSILADHSEQGACFEPIRAITKANGLMMLVGCVAESPGFSTVHLAQYDLGLSQQHYAKWLLAVRKGSPQGEVFRAIESPGCSNGFGKFYRDYIDDNNMACGYVGNAWSIAVRAGKAYQREREILTTNPLYPLCDQPDCFSCRITRGYNKRAIPSALITKAAKFVKNWGAGR